MIDLFLKYGPWSWLVFGLVLMGLEVAAPGVFLFWLGLAGLLVGLLSFAIPMSWQAQLIVFAVLSLAAVPVWRRLARSKSSTPEQGFLNRRSDALVGRVFTLEKPIQDGVGIVRVDDTVWRVSGPDAPAGSRVKVVRADGASLTVAMA
jgi:membrane protein implicated in regulation of membrane protease activity